MAKAATEAKAAKSAAKSKANAAVAADPIQAAAFMIENLSDPAKAEELAIQLNESVDYNYYQLGGILTKMESEQWFGQVGEFKGYVDSIGIGYRKAKYLQRLYTALLSAQVTWEQCAGIGWSKLRELSPVLTARNANKWLALARKLSHPDLVAAVQKALKDAKARECAKAEGDTGEGDSEETVPAGDSMVTFKVKMFADQKDHLDAAIDKAKQESGTDSTGVALRQIAAEYLSLGDVQPGDHDTAEELGTSAEAVASASAEEKSKKWTKKSLASLFKELDYEKVLEAFEVAFPHITLDVTIEGDGSEETEAA